MRAAKRSKEEIEAARNTVLTVLQARQSSGAYTQSSDLEKDLGLPGAAIRDAIRHHRRMGHLIEGSDQGYRIVTNLDAVIQHLNKRIKSMQATVRLLEAARGGYTALDEAIDVTGGL